MRSIKKRFGAQICTKLAREDDTETVDCQEDARRLKISKIITGFVIITPVSERTWNFHCPEVRKPYTEKLSTYKINDDLRGF